MSAPGRRPISRGPVRVDRWSRGPAELVCVCGYRFDPLASDWTCPHCGERWPWARRADTQGRRRTA